MSYNTPLSLLLLIGCQTNGDKPGGVDPLAGDSDRPIWDPEVDNVQNGALPQAASNSSSTTSFSWSPPEDSFDHYEVIVEAFDNVEQVLFIDSSETSITISGLKSATSYSFTLMACLNSDCTESLESDREDVTFLATTSQEMWKFLGHSDTLESLFRVLPAGSRSPSVWSFSADASSTIEGRMLLSYVDNSSDFLQGIHFGQINDVSLDEDSNIDSLISIFDNNALLNATNINRGFDQLHFTSAQMKPIMVDGSPLIRLFITSIDSENTSHLLQIDSSDGLTGLDYQEDDGGVCESLSQYNSSDHCALEYALATCSTVSESKMHSFERFQVGWETFHTSNFGASAPSFLITQGISTCQDDLSLSHLYSASFNENNNAWNLTMDDSDCAQVLVEKAINPALINHESGRMKMYYYSLSDSAYRLLYLDAEEEEYDLSLMEDSSLAREISFLYPNGEPMENNTAQNIHEMTVFLPSNEVHSIESGTPTQLMLVTLPDNTGEPNGGIGIAYLSNP